MPAANDPDRCQRTTPGGQCAKLAMLGSEYCAMHTPGKGTELQNYLITNKLLGGTVRRHAAAAQIKSLRDEIALTRAFVEVLVNSIETNAEMVAAMPRVQGYILAIEKLVSTCHQMEVKLGDLLDKSALLTLAQNIINIIATNLNEVPNRSEVIEKVAKEIVQAIEDQDNGQR